MLDNGKAYAFGSNSNGQITGIDNSTQTFPFSLINENFGIFDISCGRDHSIILKYTYKCYGKSQNETICSGNGICFKENQCSCSEGYYGNECQYFECFGRNSTDVDVCSGNGNCTRPNVCNCTNGFYGDDCKSNLQNISTVYSFGGNRYGQLGLGHENDTSFPAKILSFNYGITSLIGGVRYMFMKNNNSNYFSAGLNNVCLLFSKIVSPTGRSIIDRESCKFSNHSSKSD